MCDVDCFKEYNDTYGHQAGDECPQQVAQALREHARRPFDVAARYGGEEFAIILPDTHAPGAVSVAEEIRKAIETLAIPHAASAVKPVVSLSFGVAAMTPDQENELAALITAADRALYHSKEQGRDRVTSSIAQ
jgi:diguanylate cyclase (GGDEF)-like protein